MSYNTKYNIWGDYYGSDDDKEKKENKCECGAEKVYGAQCSRLHHALWCPMRGDVDNEDDN